MSEAGSDFTTMGQGSKTTAVAMPTVSTHTTNAAKAAEPLSKNMATIGTSAESYRGGMEGGKAAAAATSLTSLVSSTAALASNAERYARAMASAGGSRGIPAAIGKYMYRADGGPGRRGTDTIAAMLSPGEYVVNARSTKRFFSQLQAINAGHQPVYRQDGGPVSRGDTITIGDISITEPTQRETVKEFARKIKREARKGSFGSSGLF
jgi:hypothetical protein